MFGIKLNFMSIAQLGLAAMTGGTSMLASTALRTIGSQIAMNALQRLGQQMGLPPSMINLAQAAFANASGQPGLARQNVMEAARGFAREAGFSPMLSANFERATMRSMQSLDRQFDALRNDFRSLQNQINTNIGRRGADEGEEGATVGRANGQKSFLVALAEAMGALMDQKASDMNKLAGEITAATTNGKAGEINGVNGKENGSEITKLSSKTALLQAYGQELGILSNAFSQVAKSYGEAQTTNARKG
jgi:hypothetical protein